MPNRFPVSIEAEYRGQAPATEFVSRDTGEQVRVPEKLKFECELPDGNVEMLEISSTQWDKAPGAVGPKVLKRGDRFVLVGLVVLQDRGSDRGSYFRLEAVEPLVGSGNKVAA